MDSIDNGSTTPQTAPPPSHSPYTHDPRLSPLESDVLNEYARLRANLDIVSSISYDLCPRIHR